MVARAESKPDEVHAQILILWSDDTAAAGGEQVYAVAEPARGRISRPRTPLEALGHCGFRSGAGRGSTAQVLEYSSSSPLGGRDFMALVIV